MIGDPADTGQGYGSDALRALVGFGFDELRLERIGLDVYDFNERARRVYERVGFVHEGDAPPRALPRRRVPRRPPDGDPARRVGRATPAGRSGAPCRAGSSCLISRSIDSRNGSVTSGGSTSRTESFGPYAARARSADLAERSRGSSSRSRSACGSK